MPNRPVIGQTTWGATLNDHLDTSINVDGTLKSTAIDASATTINAKLARLDTAVFDVRKYGAVGNGTTDDRVAVQLALDAIRVNGGGELRFSGTGTYRIGFRAGFYGSSFKVCLFVYGDNVTASCDPGAKILINDGHANGFNLFTNPPKVITSDNVDSSGSWWLNHAYMWPSLGGAGGSNLYPTYGITPATKGKNTITLATPAQSSNFAVGNAILIRTGQTLNGAQYGEAMPDAEMNEITAINTTTGVLTLTYPLAKSYVQEYFATVGRDTATTTTSSAYPSLFGVQNIEPTTSRKLRFRNLNLVVDQSVGRGYIVNCGSVLGFEITDCRARFRECTMQTNGPYRDGSFSRNRVYQRHDSSSDSFFTSDRACGDSEIVDNYLVATGSQVGMLHIHEGTYNTTIARNRLINPPTATTNHGLQVVARGYNIAITDNAILHESTSTGSPVFADETINGLTMSNNTLTGVDSPISAVNAVVSGNRGGITSFGKPAATPFYVTHWVYFNSPASQVMCTIPATASVIEVMYQPWTAFGGGTAAATLRIGKAGAYAGWYMETTNLPVTTNHNVTNIPLFAAPSASNGYQEGSVAAGVELLYVANGATSGRCLVRIGYVLGQRGSGI